MPLTRLATNLMNKDETTTAMYCFVNKHVVLWTTFIIEVCHTFPRNCYLKKTMQHFSPL